MYLHYPGKERLVNELPFNDASYEHFLNEERLMGSKCRRCGTLYVPPRPICVQCHGDEMEWVEMKGTGTLQAFTCIAVGPPSMCEEGYDRNNPYCSGVVELDEGVKVVARIEGVDTKNPENIRVGASLRVKYLHRGNDASHRSILAFDCV
jgi:uncharacterized OB-fold protein